MDKNFINVDDLVRQRLSGGEEQERSGAWLRMRELLDKEPEKPVGLYWRRIFSAVAILLLLGTISVGGYKLTSAGGKHNPAGGAVIASSSISPASISGGAAGATENRVSGPAALGNSVKGVDNANISNSSQRQHLETSNNNSSNNNSKATSDKYTNTEREQHDASPEQVNGSGLGRSLVVNPAKSVSGNGIAENKLNSENHALVSDRKEPSAPRNSAGSKLNRKNDQIVASSRDGSLVPGDNAGKPGKNEHTLASNNRSGSPLPKDNTETTVSLSHKRNKPASALPLAPENNSGREIAANSGKSLASNYIAPHGKSASQNKTANAANAANNNSAGGVVASSAPAMDNIEGELAGINAVAKKTNKGAGVSAGDKSELGQESSHKTAEKTLSRVNPGPTGAGADAATVAGNVAVSKSGHKTAKRSVAKGATTLSHSTAGQSDAVASNENRKADHKAAKKAVAKGATGLSDATAGQTGAVASNTPSKADRKTAKKLVSKHAALSGVPDGQAAVAASSVNSKADHKAVKKTGSGIASNVDKSATGVSGNGSIAASKTSLKHSHRTPTKTTSDEGAAASLPGNMVAAAHGTNPKPAAHISAKHAAKIASAKTAASPVGVAAASSSQKQETKTVAKKSSKKRIAANLTQKSVAASSSGQNPELMPATAKKATHLLALNSHSPAKAKNTSALSSAKLAGNSKKVAGMPISGPSQSSKASSPGTASGHVPANTNRIANAGGVKKTGAGTSVQGNTTVKIKSAKKSSATSSAAPIVSANPLSGKGAPGSSKRSKSGGTPAVTAGPDNDPVAAMVASIDNSRKNNLIMQKMTIYQRRIKMSADNTHYELDTISIIDKEYAVAGTSSDLNGAVPGASEPTADNSNEHKSRRQRRRDRNSGSSNSSASNPAVSAAGNNTIAASNSGASQQLTPASTSAASAASKTNGAKIALASKSANEGSVKEMGDNATGAEKLANLNQAFNEIKYNMGAAKFAPGLTAGINGNFFGANSFKGFQFGFVGSFIFGDTWSIMSELKYFHRVNNDYTVNDDYYTGANGTKQVQLTSYSFAALHSFEMPVSARIHIANFNFFAGVNLEYSLAINPQFVSNPAPGNTTPPPGLDNAPKLSYSDFGSRFGVGYLVGASYQLSKNVMLDIRNVQTIWDNAKSSGGKIVSGQLYNSPSLQLSIGYRFGGNKEKK